MAAAGRFCCKSRSTMAVGATAKSMPPCCCRSLRQQVPRADSEAVNIRALADHVGRVAEATLFAKHDHFYRSPFDAYNDAQHNRHMQRVHVELALLQVYLPASDHRERSWVL